MNTFSYACAPTTHTAIIMGCIQRNYQVNQKKRKEKINKIYNLFSSNNAYATV